MTVELGDPLPIATVVVRDAAGNPANAGSMTLTVTLPDGSTATPGFTNTVTGIYVPGTYETVQAGPHWVRWKGSGTNFAASEEAFYVYPAGSAKPWRPTLTGVGALVPTRTLNQAPADATDPTYTGTFAATTIPTAAQVDALITEAVAWVAGSVGTVLPVFTPLAEAVAAMRTAGLVLTAYPYTEDGAPDGTAQRWLDQADAALKQLVAANASAGGTGPGDVTAPLGAACFPDPLTWLDPVTTRGYPQPW